MVAHLTEQGWPNGIKSIAVPIIAGEGRRHWLDRAIIAGEAPYGGNPSDVSVGGLLNLRFIAIRINEV